MIATERIVFQSPSLRGSGRFKLPAYSPAITPKCFNPLHCGAVVASREYFYEFLERSLSFNPLHCGAVVASE